MCCPFVQESLGDVTWLGALYTPGTWLQPTLNLTNAASAQQLGSQPPIWSTFLSSILQFLINDGAVQVPCFSGIFSHSLLFAAKWSKLECRKSLHIVSLDSCDVSVEHLENLLSNKPIRIISHWPIRIVSHTNQSRETTITYQKLHASIISSRFGLFQINLNFFHNALFLSHNVVAWKLLFILFYFFFYSQKEALSSI